MDTASREERKNILAELEAARAKLAELEKKANVSGYRAMWWITKRQWTEEERKLFGEKHFDDLLKGFNNLENAGRHTIYTGGRYDSYLLAPLIPEARSYGIFGGRKVAED